MPASALITLREGLEAALIIGIVLGFLEKSGRPHLRAAVWTGAGLAVLVSLFAAVGLTLVGAELAGTTEQVFEGTTMVLAALILTWMIFWMRRYGRQIKQNLERETASAVSGRASLGIFSLAFLAVFREGVETVLFLAAAVFASSGREVVVGALLGLAGAAALGWALYASTMRLNVQRFFDVTSVLLILFAAGLVAHGVHEFNEAGLVPAVVEHVWNAGSILSDQSVAGQMLKTLFGYNPAPSLTEVLAYLTYLAAVGAGVRRWSQEHTGAAAQVA